jgi:hypothetical protein
MPNILHWICSFTVGEYTAHIYSVIGESAEWQRKHGIWSIHLFIIARHMGHREILMCCQ